MSTNALSYSNNDDGNQILAIETAEDYERFRCKAVTRRGGRCSRLRCVKSLDFCLQHEKSKNKQTKELECSICYEQFYNTECIHLNHGCNHKFCSSCITKWSMDNRSCPMCRAEIHLDDYKKCLSHAILFKFLILIQFRNVMVRDIYFDFLNLSKRHNLCSEEHDIRRDLFGFLKEKYNNKLISQCSWEKEVLPVFLRIFHGLNHDFTTIYLTQNTSLTPFYIANKNDIYKNRHKIHNRLIF